MNNKVTGRLENWFIDTISYGAPVIWGELYDDVRNRFKEGQHVHTSSILSSLDNLKTGDIVITENSSYLLGIEQIIRE